MITWLGRESKVWLGDRQKIKKRVWLEFEVDQANVVVVI